MIYRKLLAIFIFALQGCFVFGQQADRTDLQNEVDVWKGSSLGIRLEFEDSIPIVSDIYPHVESSSPFLRGDRILKIGNIAFPDSTIDKLSDYLSETDPASNVAALVERDAVKLNLNVQTFRKEFVDIHAIHRRLSKNRIIGKHLENEDRSSFFEDVTERMASAVTNSNSPRTALEAINKIIDEIGVSHTAIIPASAGLGFSMKAKGALGLLLQRHTINDRTGYFVVDRKPGSVAYKSEIFLGDEILSINGVPVANSRRLDLSGHEDRYQLFSIEAQLGEEVEIEFLRSPFDDSDVTKLAVDKDPTTVASLKASASTISTNDIQVGYLRFWNLMSMGVGTEFSRKVKNDFVDCDSIIMDLRGRGGIVPAVTSINRSVGKIQKPVVVIIDNLTRSAKEMLAYLLKKQDHVLVIGSKTAGAVTGATINSLPSGNSLMIPVASADSLKQFIDGAIIEGVGVEPDEQVNYFVPYSAGHDLLLQQAVKRAVDLVTDGKAAISGND